MTVFSKDSRGIEAWGPTASVAVEIGALGGIVDDSWILVNFAIGVKEIVDVRQCFNDVSFMYALGNDQTGCRMTLTFAILIGTRRCKGDNNMAAISAGLSKYIQNRISQQNKPNTIAIANFAGKGWLTGIDIGQVDASRGICYGTVHFIIRVRQ